MSIPSEARIVIIGGGISGCSLAYHLAKIGWKDIVLLERKKLTSGTTWHAAGLIGQLRPNLNMTRLAKYSADLYVNLEKETGVSTGVKQNGSLTVALTEHRHEEILRQSSIVLSSIFKCRRSKGCRPSPTRWSRRSREYCNGTSKRSSRFRSKNF